MNHSTYTISTFSPTSPPSYAHDLAAQALAGARAGKRVALLVWPGIERQSIERTITQLLEPGETEWNSVPVPNRAARASMPRRLYLLNGGSIFLSTYAEEVMGFDFDLVVASGSIPLDSDLLKEARGRLHLRVAQA